MKLIKLNTMSPNFKKIISLILMIQTVSIYSQNEFEEEFKEFMATQYEQDKLTDYDNLSKMNIPFTKLGFSDVNYIPALVNGFYDYFVFDTGCSYGLAINNNLFNKILDSKSIFVEDFIGFEGIQTAVGNYVVIKAFVLNEVIIGTPTNSMVLKNVLTAVYDSNNGPLLLGQDILNRFSSITINNKNEHYAFNK